MTELFLQTVNLSYRVSFLILAILLLRLVLKKAPKWISVALWGIAAVRLLLPFSLESIFSMMPSGDLVAPEIMLDPTPTIQSGIPVINDVINPIIQHSFAPTPGASMNPLQLWLPVVAIIWTVGFAVLVLYTLISYWKLKKQVSGGEPVCGRIYRTKNIPSPFVLGLLRPRIYLPDGISETDEAFVIAHEEAHIRRRDHWWKPIGFLLLSLHWFNPLMWLGYIFLCRDIELACDEKVIEKLGEAVKADYSQALLNCSVSRKRIAACPLAFGEVGVKQRIQSVLHYRKPAFWILAAAITLSIAVAVCFLTDPIVPKVNAAEPNQGRVVTLFDEDANWSVTVSSHVPGKPGITILIDRNRAGIAVQIDPTITEITQTEGTNTILFSGMPIRNAYFCDLNSDGVSELCAGTYFGSGIVDARIVVYDFVDKRSYILADRGNRDFYLSNEGGALIVTVTDYRTKNIVAKGPLVLEKTGDNYRLICRE